MRIQAVREEGLQTGWLTGPAVAGVRGNRIREQFNRRAGQLDTAAPHVEQQDHRIEDRLDRKRNRNENRRDPRGDRIERHPDRWTDPCGTWSGPGS